MLGNCFRRLAIRDILTGWRCQDRKPENFEVGSKELFFFGMEPPGQLCGYSDDHNISATGSLVNIAKNL